VSEALNGAGMDGMTVTACPLTGGCETKTWAATSLTGGAAQGTDWSLGLIGDSFNSNFVFQSNSGVWRSLSINTRDGLAAFDWIADPVLSPESDRGKPFRLISLDTLAEPTSVDVVYSDVLFVDEVGYDDLYTVMTISFLDAQGAPFGFSGRMEFLADTDKTEKISAYDPNASVPTPATMALVGLGLAGVAASRRKTAGGRR
jgi:hypothetical protein